MQRLVMAINTWELATGNEVLPRLPVPPPEGDDVPNGYDFDHEVDLAIEVRLKVQVRINEALATIYSSCRPIRFYIDDYFEPIRMWQILAKTSQHRKQCWTTSILPCLYNI